MTLLLPKELVHARELMDQAKLDEALEIIENFEKEKSLTQEDQISALLIKGSIYHYTLQYEKFLKIYERAYQMSQDLGLVPESIEALIGKAIIGIIGDFDSAYTYILDAETRLNSLADDPSSGILRRKLLYMKSWMVLLKGNPNGAEKLAKKCLKLIKEQELGNKLDLASTFFLLGWIKLYQYNQAEALDYAMNSLGHHKELNHIVAIGVDYSLIARIYRFEGDYDQALQYCKQSLSFKEIPKRTRIDGLMNLSDIYYLKSELNRALKYRQQAVTLDEELNITDQLIINLVEMGYLYSVYGKKRLAVEYFERSLALSDKWGLIFTKARALMLLILTYIEEKSHVKANRYLSRLSELYDQSKNTGDIVISFSYLASKAYMMKTSKKKRDRVEAQSLFKKLVDSSSGENLIFSMGNLCDLLLEDLLTNNDPEILGEIISLITKSLEMAEKAHNYWWLAETKLLQAKLALIQMNIGEARRLMVEAQRIAELRGLNLLALGISNEHDKLLDQIDIWDTIKKEKAPLSARVKLASTNEVLERIQGRRAAESLQLVELQSIVLLILAEGGILIFSFPFSDEWEFDEELFGGFLTAFNSISDEIFSEGLDRVKFGKQTVLMENVANFSFCYLFKGQTYLAKQKLLKFVEEIQNNLSLWQSLEKHYKTSQVLELKDNPYLESLITEIFTSKS